MAKTRKKKVAKRRIVTDKKKLINILTKNTDLTFAAFQKKYPKVKVISSTYYHNRKKIIEGRGAGNPGTESDSVFLSDSKRRKKPGPKPGFNKTKKLSDSMVAMVSQLANTGIAVSITIDNGEPVITTLV